MADNNGNTTKGFIIGALVIAVAVLGYFLFMHEANEPDLSISVSEDGLEIEGN